ncbi:muramidase family protein [Thioflexithrix psekupsensis]|uniref:LysM domain-containing protein n=1 Tax=Thioflexithrix psekupsensis TaxID=1570016 RepID=A0A251X768_9GAMM|nr:LysM peptidoglycan-binding domain-containing protein [Thioflexithrix psekupsensis]OUD13821.1 hypothetical protein TPSD3_05595 [Thioflexithrix psekupsensis]
MMCRLHFRQFLGIVAVGLLSGCTMLTPGPTEPVDTTPIPPGSPGIIDTTQPPSTGGQMPLYHTVQPGETLYGISQRYNQQWQQIAQWNNIQPPYNLSVGQRLLVSASGGMTGTPSGPVIYPIETAQPPAPVIIDTQPSFPSQPSTPAVVDRQLGYHTVQAGETLFSISRRYGYTPTQVAEWNGLPPPYTLSIGQMLLVSPPDGVSGIVTSPTAPVTAPNLSAPNSGQHVVQTGETLFSIARRYGHTVEQVASWNGLTPPYTLSVGQRLLVSPSGSVPVATTPSVSANVSYHTVAAGETLFSISRRYGNTVEQVAAWNRLTPPYSLSVGQRLTVGQAGTTQTGLSAASSSPRLSQSSSSTTRGSIGFHTVQPGETLASIARDYRLTTHDLSIWNGIGMPYTVYPGQRLLIVPP